MNLVAHPKAQRIQFELRIPRHSKRIKHDSRRQHHLWERNIQAANPDVRRPDFGCLAQRNRRVRREASMHQVSETTNAPMAAVTRGTSSRVGSLGKLKGTRGRTIALASHAPSNANNTAPK